MRRTLATLVVLLTTPALLDGCQKKDGVVPDHQPPHEVSAMAQRKETLLTQLGPGLQSTAEDKELLDELVDAWLLEAGDGDDAGDILEILRNELTTKISGKTGADRTEALRYEVYDRRIRTVSVRSFELAKAVLDGKVERKAAETEGKELMAKVADLQKLVRGLVDQAATRPLTVNLEQALLDSQYAVHRKVMSLRLGRYGRGKGGGGLRLR